MRKSQWTSKVIPLLFWAVILAVTAWLYWPGIGGPAILDDRASVTVMDSLNDNPGFAMDYVFGDVAGPLGRPVSMVSFVMEKLYLDRGISGGKSINIVLHLINGCLVVWLFTLLLSHIRVPAHRYLAVLAGSAWLFSPLYVSTVLYVVQRMAMLATFFMLAACISYVYWRASFARGRLGITLLLLTLALFVLAVFSKETAIVLLPLLLLLECLWFEFNRPDGTVLKGLRFFVLTLIFAGAAFVCIFFMLEYDWLVESYSIRSFSLSERMLTECRILWDYISQLIRPDVTRMGLYHDDVTVSVSLLQPITTLYAVLAWLGILLSLLVMLKWRRGRYLVFTASIFLIGHSTESTILPLELYYEHRSYFPGVGLFLGVAVLLGFLFKKWPELTAPILFLASWLVMILALRTSSQVQIWSSAPLLYISHVNGHPESFRANVDMANLMAEVGALQAALEYSATAHNVASSERQGDYDIRDLALSCTVNQPLPTERIAALGMADPQRPLGSVSTLNVLVRQLQDNECPKFDRLLFADRMAVIFLGSVAMRGQDWRSGYEPKAAPNIYAGLAVLENSLDRYDNAYQYVDRFLEGSPGNVRGLLMKLHFATALQKGTEVTEILSRLLELEEAGILTVADQQTLSLYKDN